MKLDLTKLEQTLKKQTLEQVLLRFTTPIGRKEKKDPIFAALAKGYKATDDALALNVLGILDAFYTQGRVFACITREYASLLASGNQNANYGLDNNQYKILFAHLLKIKYFRIFKQTRMKPTVVELIHPEFRAAILAKGIDADLQLAECLDFIAPKQQMTEQEATKPAKIPAPKVGNSPVMPLPVPISKMSDTEIKEMRDSAKAIAFYKAEIAKDQLTAELAVSAAPEDWLEKYPTPEPLYDPELRYLLGFRDALQSDIGFDEETS